MNKRSVIIAFHFTKMLRKIVKGSGVHITTR